MTNIIPWVEKYRPKKLSELSQDNELVNLFRNIIDTGDIPHLLFYGPPGTGKTSSILALGRELFKEHYAERIIEYNASNDRGINAVREKISYDAKKYVSRIVKEDGTIIPGFKIIVLDEADAMTDEAQDALRVSIEESSLVTRFCFICNYISRITDAIKSRCSHVYFKKLTDDCMISKLNEISIKESMDLPKNIYQSIIEISNGDMRKAIMILQNVKYLYNYKKLESKPLPKMTMVELSHIYTGCNNESVTSKKITISDVYNVSANIDNEKAANIITDTIACTTIKEISTLSKNIIAMGYPVDNILLRLNDIILKSTTLNNYQKATIFKYATKILFKMKESSNEYLQLIDYLGCVYSIANNKNLDLY